MFNPPEKHYELELQWQRAVERCEEEQLMKTRLIGFTLGEIHSLRVVIHNAREAYAQMPDGESQEFDALIAQLNNADIKLEDAYEFLAAGEHTRGLQ